MSLLAAKKEEGRRKKEEGRRESKCSFNFYEYSS
jgi:hypothetical protein